MLAPIEYLQWYRNQSSAEYDLGGTDLRPDHPDGRRLVPEAIADVDDPPDDVGLGTILSEEYNVNGGVAIASGARHAYMLGVMAALGRADGDGAVLVEDPAFEPLYSTPAGFGARVDRFTRPAPGYELDPDRIAAAMEPDTALVTITNRHNPSGHLADRATLAEVAEIVADHDAVLLSDEVYAPYVSELRDGAFGGPTAAGLPNTAVIGSLTKFHGIGELRVGWLTVPEVLGDAVGAINMHCPTVGAPNRILGARALYTDRLERRARRLIRTNHDLLADFVADHPSLTGVVHDESTFGFLGHERASGEEIVAAAREEGLIVIPGRFFGDPDRVRIGLGREESAMKAALSMFDSALGRLSN